MYTLPIRIGETIRDEHTANYTVFSNHILRTTQLSSRAKVILLELLSRPDNWRIVPKFLAQQMNLSTNTVAKYLRELEECGYILRERIRDDAGRFIGSIHKIMESSTLSNFTPPSDSFSPTTQKTTAQKTTPRKLVDLVNTEVNNEQPNQITILPPSPLNQDEEERDLWFSSDLEPDTSQEVIVVPVTLEPETRDIDLSTVCQPTEILSTTPVSSEERSPAADYKKNTEVVIRSTRKERQKSQREATWLEFGSENGLWTTLEELQGFMTALYAFAINNPRLHTPSKWVESEVEKTCVRGTGTHWIEYKAGLDVGTIDKKPWADVYGNTNLSFRSYIEQSKFGEAGNSTARAVELAAMVLSDPFKAGLMWNEYQRRLERELEEKAKCERLGITYDAPGVLKPKNLVSAEHTAEVQQLLRIDTAALVSQPVIDESVVVPALAAEAEESEDARNLATKMALLGEKMGISKQSPEVTPLSSIYAEPQPVNQKETEEFKVWYDWAKAENIVAYSYSDPNHHAIVVLADGVTALPWREAKIKHSY
jgi:DNA-binding transcriptional regulator YhcF (GntR family)